jgi:hypothetical protein
MSVLIWGCSAKRSDRITSLAKSDNIYVFDLDKIRNNGSLSMSSLFKKVIPIVLETRDDVLIGSINAIQVYKDRVYVLDRQQKILFVFDMNGLFIRKIGSIGSGPGEYLEIVDFTINYDKDEIYLYDPRFQKIHKYKPDGSHVGAIDVPYNNNAISHIRYAAQGIYTDMHNFEHADDYLLQLINMETGKQEKRFLSVDQYNKGWSELFGVEQGPFVSRGKELKYVQIFADTIVRIDDKGGVSPFITMKGKGLTTKGDLDALKVSYPKDPYKRYNHIMMQTQKIFGVFNYVENDKFILFSCHQGSTVFKVLHNLSTNSTYMYNTMQNDLVYTGDSHLMTKFNFFDENGAYEYIDTGYSMSNLIEQIANGKLAADLENMDKLLKLTDDSNPVIFYYQFK